MTKQELEKSIIDKLSEFRGAWKILCDDNNLHLSGRIVAMEIAINVVKKAFKEPQSKTLYEQIMSEMTIGKMAALRIKEDKDFIYASDGTSFDKKSIVAFRKALQYEICLLNQVVTRE